MPQQRGRNFWGLGKETVKGTAVAAVDYLPWKTFEPVDMVKYLEDLGVRGSAVDVYGLVPGPAWSEVQFGGDVFPESIPRLAYSLFGDITSTGAAGAKSGTMAALAVGAITGTYTVVAGGAPVANDVIQIDVGGIAEVRKLTSVSGAGPYTVNWAATGGLLFAHAGAAAAVNTTAPYVTAFSELNTGDTQGPAMTFAEFNGFNARQWPGQQVAELAFRINPDGLLEYTGKSVGFPSATFATPIPAYNVNPPVANWNGQLQFGGVQNVKFQAGEFTITRPTNPEHNIDTSQSPYKVWQGNSRIKGKFTFFYEDDTDLIRYLTNTQPTTVFQMQTGAGVTLRQIQLTMTKCGFRDPTKILRSSGDRLLLEMPFEAIANITDAGGSGGYSPGRLQFQSAVYDYTT